MYKVLFTVFLILSVVVSCREQPQDESSQSGRDSDDSAKIEIIGDSSPIEIIGDSSQIEIIGDSSQIGGRGAESFLEAKIVEPAEVTQEQRATMDGVKQRHSSHNFINIEAFKVIKETLGEGWTREMLFPFRSYWQDSYKYHYIELMEKFYFKDFDRLKEAAGMSVEALRSIIRENLYADTIEVFLLSIIDFTPEQKANIEEVAEELYRKISNQKHLKKTSNMYWSFNELSEEVNTNLIRMILKNPHHIETTISHADMMNKIEASIAAGKGERYWAEIVFPKPLFLKILARHTENNNIDFVVKMLKLSVDVLPEGDPEALNFSLKYYYNVRIPEHIESLKIHSLESERAVAAKFEHLKTIIEANFEAEEYLYPETPEAPETPIE